MRLRSDTLSAAVFAFAATLLTIAGLSLFSRIHSTDDYRFAPVKVECNAALISMNYSRPNHHHCKSNASNFEVRIPADSIDDRASFFFPRIVVPNKKQSASLEIDMKLTVNRIVQGVVSELNLEWKELKVMAQCGVASCRSDIVRHFTPEKDVDFVINIKLTSITDNNQALITDFAGANELSLEFFEYFPRDGHFIAWLKVLLVIVVFIFFRKFNRSLNSVRLQEKLTVQMFTKYLGFLAIFFNLPILLGTSRSKNFFSIIAMLFESLFFSYLVVFFLIITPSIAFEHSTAITQYNTAWKKIFLLAYFSLLLALKATDFHLIETEGGRDLTDSRLNFLRLALSSLTVFWALFTLAFSLLSFRRRSALEMRSKLLLCLTVPAAILAAVAFISKKPESLFGEALLHVGLSVFVVSLEIFFAKVPEIVDGGQPQVVTNKKLDLISRSTNIQSDSIGTTEDSREDTDGNFNNQLADDAKKQPHNPEREEVSYEIEREE